MRDSNKKIIGIIVAVVLAIAVTVGIILIAKPDGKAKSENFTVKFNGNDSKTLTASIKGKNVPDDYFWHIVDENGDVFSYEIKKSKKNKVELKLYTLGKGEGKLYVYADRNEDAKELTLTPVKDPYENLKEGEQPKAKDIKAYDKYQELYRNTERLLNRDGVLAVMSLSFTVDGKLKFREGMISVSEGNIPVPIKKGMKNPVYSRYVGGDIEISVPYYSSNFSIEIDDEAVISYEGPTLGDNKTSFIVSARSLGKTKTMLVNKDLGIKTMIEFQVTKREVKEGTTDGAEQEAIKALEISDVSEDTEQVYSDEEIASVQGILNIVSKLPMPSGAVIREYKGMKKLGNGRYDDGNELASILVGFRGHQYSYVVTDKIALADLKDNFDVMKGKNIEEKSEKVGDINVEGYEFKNGEDVCVAGCYVYDGVTCVLSSQKATWEDAIDFITSLELRDPSKMKKTSK